MNIDLTKLEQNDIDNFINFLKEGDIFKQESVEGCCQSFVQKLYELCVGAEGAAQLILSRIFIVLHFTQLTDDLKQAALDNVGSPQAETLNYLVLFGTYGKEENWCSRKLSQGHKAIPLTEDTVKTIHMVARFLQQVVFDLNIILSKDRNPGIVLEGMNQLYGVFYVPHAKASPYIPAQDGFVIPYKVQSAIGSGTCLPAGIPMIYIGFASVAIPDDAAPKLAPLMSAFGRELSLQFINERYFIS